MAADYEIRLTDPYGSALIEQAEFISLDVAKSVNTIGSCVLTLPDIPLYTSLIPFINNDGRIEIWRRPMGSKSRYLVGKCPFIIEIVSRKTDSNGKRTLTVNAKDGLLLLQRRFVLYQEGTVFANKTDLGDDLIKAYADENIGAGSTDPARSWATYLTIEGDYSMGGLQAKGAAWRNLLSVFQEISQTAAQAGDYLAFDVEWLDAEHFILRTFVNWRGRDRRGESFKVLIGPAYGNLTEPNWQSDYSGLITHATVGGSSSGLPIVIGSAQDDDLIAASPFGRREMYTSAMSATTIAECQYEAQGILWANRPRHSLSGNLLKNEKLRWDVEIGYGDVITVEFEDEHFDARLDNYRLSVGDSGERLSVTCRGDSLL